MYNGTINNMILCCNVLCCAGTGWKVCPRRADNWLNKGEGRHPVSCSIVIIRYYMKLDVDFLPCCSSLYIIT